MKKLLFVFVFLSILLPVTKINAFSPKILLVNDELKICKPFQGAFYSKDWHPFVYDDGNFLDQKELLKQIARKLVINISI